MHTPNPQLTRSEQTPGGRSSTIPVVLDVDTGLDDALAILLAVRSHQLDVRAITCVAGNVGLDQVVDNTLRILALAGRADVPVAPGMSQPLLGPARDASYIHGSDGVGGVALPDPLSRPVSDHAVILLRDVITAAEAPVTVVALAPLTNIAALLRMFPGVAENIDRILFMGGAIGQGNASASAEFNIWHDPEAADIVLRSGVRLVMYGLEPFYSVACTDAEIRELRDSRSAVASTAGSLLAFLAESEAPESRVTARGGASIGDAGVVCAAILGAATETVRAPVEISLSDPLTRGRTVVDMRTGKGAGGVPEGAMNNVDVVVSVDQSAYIGAFMEALR